MRKPAQPIPSHPNPIILVQFWIWLLWYVGFCTIIKKIKLRKKGLKVSVQIQKPIEFQEAEERERKKSADSLSQVSLSISHHMYSNITIWTWLLFFWMIESVAYMWLFLPEVDASGGSTATFWIYCSIDSSYYCMHGVIVFLLIIYQLSS